jgi:hypothetical protein
VSWGLKLVEQRTNSMVDLWVGVSAWLKESATVALWGPWSVERSVTKKVERWVNALDVQLDWLVWKLVD